MLDYAFRELPAGTLNEKSLEDNDKFGYAILSKFDEVNVSLISYSEVKADIGVYPLITGVNAMLDKQIGEDTISGNFPILLLDINYRYTPTDGYAANDSSSVRVNLKVDTKTKQYLLEDLFSSTTIRKNH